MTARADIVREARSLKDTPFHHQACAKGIGIDCVGVLRHLGKTLDITGSREFEASVEFMGYGEDPDPALLRACERFLDTIPRAEVKAGDVLLFKTRYSQGQPKHFGVVTAVDPLYMVHAWALGKGKVAENRVDATWERRIVGCYRFRGIDG